MGIGIGNCCCVTTCSANPTIAVKCNSVGVTGATVTVTSPSSVTYTFSHVGSGNYSYFTALTGTAGDTWSYSVSKSGFTTATGTFTFTCGSSTINVTLVHAGVTISGTVYGCAGQPLSGATVAASGFSSATTSSTGTYSIFVASSNATFNLTASKSGYASITQSITVNCGTWGLTGGGSGAGAFSLNPATGNQCLSCSIGVFSPTYYFNEPIPETLYLTSDFLTATLSYDSTVGGWRVIQATDWLGCTNDSCNSANPTGMYPFVCRFTMTCGLKIEFSQCVVSGGSLVFRESGASGSPSNWLELCSPSAAIMSFYNDSMVAGSVSLHSGPFMMTGYLRDDGNCFRDRCTGTAVQRTCAFTITG